MPTLSPPTLTEAEQRSILAATASNLRDHLIYSLALGTGLRLAEIVGLNVVDVFAPDGTPRSRARIRPEIAKGGRSGDVFLPDALVAKLRRFWAHKAHRGEGLRPEDPLFCGKRPAFPGFRSGRGQISGSLIRRLQRAPRDAGVARWSGQGEGQR